MERELQDLEDALIGIVYDTAADPTFWPVILEGLDSVMADETTYSELREQRPAGAPHPDGDMFSASPVSSGQVPWRTSSLLDEPGEERRLEAKLAPHIRRAFELNRRLVKAEDERDLLRDLQGQLPFGILVMDEAGTILFQNKIAAGMIASSHVIGIEKQRLRVTDARLRQALHEAFGATGARLDLGEIANRPGLALVVGPLRTCELKSLGSRRLRTIFICSGDYESMLSLERLAEFYGLTGRESCVARQIACGMSPDAIAQRAGVKVATVRDQLKTIYEKTGAHSQNRLAFMILTNPAVWCSSTQPDVAPGKCPEPGLHRESRIALSDGRTLCYAEYGDLSGFPVFLMHSLWGGRYERYPYDRLTAQLGVRLIVADRPGFGGSTYRGNHSYQQWGRDFLELTDALGIDECSVISFSAASHALACAYVAPHRLRRVSLYSSWGPIEGLADVLKMPPQYRFLLGVGLYLPSLAEKFMRLHMRGMCRQPLRLFRQLTSHAPAIDAAVVRDPRLERNFVTSIFEGSGRSGEGMMDEFRKFIAPWDLPLGEISMPVDIYLGAQDYEIHVHMARKLARLLPDARLHEVAGAGAFPIFSHWSEALQAAKSPAQVRAADTPIRPSGPGRIPDFRPSR